MSLDAPLGIALAILIAMAGWELATLMTVGHHASISLSAISERIPAIGLGFAFLTVAVASVIVVHLLTETGYFH